jgi:hypothetical protein
MMKGWDQMTKAATKTRSVVIEREIPGARN